MSTDKKITYEHHAKYYETDQMGIIHHSNYIRWMEEARIEAMRQMGISYKAMEENGIISPVLAVSCEYRSMTRFDDVVIVEVTLVKYNGIRMELEYVIKDKETEEIRATASSKHCFLNKQNRPVSLKRACPEFDKLFAANLIDEA